MSHHGCPRKVVACTHENMLAGGSSLSSSLSELAPASTQHRSSRHTRPPTRTSTVARSNSVPECSGREQVACSVSWAQTHDMPAIRREPRRTRGQGETGRRHSRRGWPPFVRVRGLSKVRDWRHDRIGNVSNRIHYEGGEGGGGGGLNFCLNFWGSKQALPSLA